MRLLLALVAILAASQATQAQNVYNVTVTHSDRDMVGERLVYQIREGIRRSEGMALAGPNDVASFSISLITLDTRPSNPGHQSLYAVSYLVHNSEAPFAYLVGSIAGLCPDDSVESVADLIVGGMDRAIMETLERIR